MMLETIRAKFKIIVQHGHEVPLVHRAIINKQNSIEISESSQDGEWAESVMPMLANFEEETWSLEKCFWWALQGQYSTDATALWVESVFTNSVWNLLDQIGEKPARERLVSACVHFGDQVEHIDMDTPPPNE